MFNLPNLQKKIILSSFCFVSIFFQPISLSSTTKKQALSTTNSFPKAFRPIRASSIEGLRQILTQFNFFNPQEGFHYYFITDFDGVLLPQSGNAEENIDPAFAEIIEELKDQKVIVGGITNRSKKKSKESLSAFEQAFGGFNLLPDLPEEFFGQKGLFKQGVFYVGHAFSKGKALKTIIDRIKERDKTFDPSKIILCYIDDSPNNLIKINKTCRKIGIKNPVIIHYLADDQSMNSVSFGGFMNGKFQNTTRRFFRKHFPMFEKSFF